MWKVHRFNERKNENVIAAPNYATGEDAFDAAWDNMGAFVKAARRSGSVGDIDGPPANEWRYKIWVVTKSGNVNHGFRLVWDFPTAVPNDPKNTNSITWRIVEI